ncbi:hypothetical protein ACWCP6_00245 [Streptomyces sp. NPDC002004]
MKSVARLARAEWRPLWETARDVLTARGWRAIPLTLCAVCLTALLQYVQNRPWGYPVIQELGAPRAADPLPHALLRTPLSVFVPALDLPVWGALVQILLVFGIAEIFLGWRHTLSIAYLATLCGTLYARVAIAIGPDSVVGLPGTQARVVDAGPSAAVVGLAVYVAVRNRAYVTASLVASAMAVEALCKPNLAGKEHLAAIAGVLTLYGVTAVRQRRSVDRVGSGSGLPPIQS